MKQISRLMCRRMIFLMLISYPSTTKAQQVLIDTSDLSEGNVKISYDNDSYRKLKVLIQKGTECYTYDLDGEGKIETFALQLGNGTYTIGVLENTTGTKYRWIEEREVILEMEDSNDVYLNSVQNIEWDESMECIIQADEKCAPSIDELVGDLSIYHYIVTNFVYDYSKFNNVPSTYLPDIDETYKTQTGNCYDFSALYAGMLRSLGIPTKLVMGYTPNAQGYHAWNEVYNEETEEWYVIDITYDLQMFQHKLEFQSIKPAEDYDKVYEY